eukprot:4620031-Pleurochrysis_carterae.AAC.2
MCDVCGIDLGGSETPSPCTFECAIGVCCAQAVGGGEDETKLLRRLCATLGGELVEGTAFDARCTHTARGPPIA